MRKIVFEAPENSILETLILVVLDESGSMAGQQKDVIDGFNKFLEEQQTLKDPCRMSLIKFNDEKTVVFEPTPIQEVKLLTVKTYKPNGCTALFDAVAEAVVIADSEANIKERVICLIITDGQENSSTEVKTYDQIKAIIKEHEGYGNWTFVYLGVDPDKWHREVGGSIGNVLVYNPLDTKNQYGILSTNVAAYRCSAAPQTTNFWASMATTGTSVQNDKKD